MWRGRPKKRGWSRMARVRARPAGWPDWIGDRDLERVVRIDALSDIELFDAAFLEELAGTTRLIWQPTDRPLSWGEPRNQAPRWVEKRGYFELSLGPGLFALRACSLHYIDPAASTIGQLDVGGALIEAALFDAPPVPAAAFPGIRAGFDRLLQAPLAADVAADPAFQPPVPRVEVEVSDRGGELELAVHYAARYPGGVVALDDPWEQGEVARDPVAEALHRERAGQLFDQLGGRIDAAAIADRLVPTLRAEGWEVEVSGIELDSPIVAHEWHEALEEIPGGDWFRLSLGVDIDGETVSLLPPLLKALRSRRIDLHALASEGCPELIVELSGGRRLYVPGDRVRRWLRPLIELELRGVEDGELRVPGPAAPELALDARFAGREALAAVRDRLSGLVELEPRPEPPGFAGQLREYQRQGFAWLHHLERLGYGGILADDMGLGKTVQLLALFEEMRVAGRLESPALVVAPLSVVRNWQREAARFAPEIEARVHHGAGRSRQAGALAGAQLVITSYQTLLRDRAMFAELEWSALVCDEAQAIKNPRTKLFGAIARLRAAARFCVTGTPIENSLGDLWSQMQIAMPGLLGTAKGFAKIRSLIERGHADLLELVRRRIRPFMLRRSKADVDINLPAKTEIVERVELSGKQRDLYESLRLALDKKVRDALARRGVQGSALIVLDALLKLRQSCCDPRLVKVDAAAAIAESAKLDRLTEMLDELVDAGRSTLVFSQFAAMLDLIERACERRGIATLKLTGATRDRETLIDRFQAGEAPVFLISLKAGGTGINLTRADTVIHYDPWWNPAVEAQATDRVHRIGQTRPVFVYKLVAASSVEERVLELQEQKLHLADAALTGAGVTHLSAADLAALFESLD
jgi:superfamily II DNA or RNA helicase